MKIEFFPEIKAKPVLLIYDGTPSEVADLQNAFHKLALGENDELNIHLLPGVQPVDGCRLVAQLNARNEGVESLDSASSFRWRLTESRWQDIAEMIEPLKKPWRGGHVFLEVKSYISLIISAQRGW